MTKARALEVISSAKSAAVIAFGGNETMATMGWSTQLDKVLRDGERNEVNEVWGKMPRPTNFVNALRYTAKGK